MAAVMKGPIGIVGLGLIGGSLAEALVARGRRVKGCSLIAEDVHLAEREGVEAFLLPEREMSEAIGDCPLVVVAVPLKVMYAAALETVRTAAPDATIFHVASLQGQDAINATEEIWRRVLGTHPMAGLAHSGFRHARADLFVGRSVSVEARARPRERELAEWFWHLVGATRITYRSAEEHDTLMAWVSHLPQILATALAATLARAGVDPATLGPGGRDGTRVAMSPLGTWQSLLDAACTEDGAALAALSETLAELREVIVNGDTEALRDLWSIARTWRLSAEGEAK
jgi:prephenate dehydrogenase